MFNLHLYSDIGFTPNQWYTIFTPGVIYNLHPSSSIQITPQQWYTIYTPAVVFNIPQSVIYNLHPSSDIQFTPISDIKFTLKQWQLIYIPAVIKTHTQTLVYNLLPRQGVSIVASWVSVLFCPGYQYCSVVGVSIVMSWVSLLFFPGYQYCHGLSVSIVLSWVSVEEDCVKVALLPWGPLGVGSPSTPVIVVARLNSGGGCSGQITEAILQWPDYSCHTAVAWLQWPYCSGLIEQYEGYPRIHPYKTLGVAIKAPKYKWRYLDV